MWPTSRRRCPLVGHGFSASVIGVLSLLVIAGCKPPPPPSLRVSAAHRRVAVGGSPIALSAVVEGSTSAVEWEIKSGGGTVSPKEGLGTLYTPPAAPTGASAVVVAARAAGVQAEVSLKLLPAGELYWGPDPLFLNPLDPSEKATYGQAELLWTAPALPGEVFRAEAKGAVLFTFNQRPPAGAKTGMFLSFHDAQGRTIGWHDEARSRIKTTSLEIPATVEVFAEGTAPPGSTHVWLHAFVDPVARGQLDSIRWSKMAVVSPPGRLGPSFPGITGAQGPGR